MLEMTVLTPRSCSSPDKRATKLAASRGDCAAHAPRTLAIALARPSPVGIIWTQDKAVAGSLRAQLLAIPFTTSSRLWPSGRVKANCAAASGSREDQLFITLSSIRWRDASAGRFSAKSTASFGSRHDDVPAKRLNI